MIVTEEEAKKYPWLVPTEGWYGPDEIPDNWKPIVLELCKALSNYFDQHPNVDRYKYHLDQGKEKYASACWYDSYENGEWPDNSRKEIHDIVKKYIETMNQTCIHCGKPNAKVQVIKGWWYLLCNECYNKKYNDYLSRFN